MVNFFVSLPFLAGVPVALIIYYLLPTARLQVPFLIGTSLIIFWFAAGGQVLLVCFAALVTALASLAAVQTQATRRRLGLSIGVALNLALLIFFKYKRLLIPEALYRQLFGASPAISALYDYVLPVGISFYVFHGISLIVDSYRDRTVIDAAAEAPNLFAHLARTWNYITFFPQIVAGPIVKGKAFYGQIRRKRYPDVRWWDAISALSQGYFLKEVIANNLNQSTAPMTNPMLWAAKPSVELVAMLIGYSAQIFADFAGYSLIAIGLGRLFGYELPINFHRPYFADSFAAFWRSWHISLSSWLRDYLYIPLGGNRRGPVRTYFNLAIVMVLGGLWHGPEWKYAFWGLAHGMALSTERFGRELAERRGWSLGPLAAQAIHPLRVTLVFAYVTVAWLLFRMPSITDVTSFLEAIIHWHGSQQLYTGANLRILWGLSALVLVHHGLSYLREREFLPRPVLALEPAFYGSLLALACVVGGKETAFIYFQF
jgi:alginate O-acetyltransferase complex protein AlgI